MGIVWTLRARGLAPSLGAGGSLVVAALCCLLLATAVITFRDWPATGADAAPGGTLTMPAPAAKAAGRAASGPSAPAAVPVTGGDAGSRPTSRRRAGARRPPAAAPGPGPAGTNPPAAAAPAPVAPAPAPAPAAAPVTSQPPAAQSQPRPARDAGTVEGTVEQVREQEAQLPLPPAVREPVQPVLDTVQQAGRTVDDVTKPLLPPLP